jgi:hypothetical protein
MEYLGGGLVAVAFWGFVASCVLGGVWYSIREKEAQHETLRSIIESGRDIDADLIDRVMNDGGKANGDLRVAGYITMSVAPGLALLGYVLEVATDNDKIFTIMLGIGGLVIFVAIGMLFAARVMERRSATRDETPLV